MNDCPACGLEYDREMHTESRTPSIEVENAKVCARAEYDRHNYAYVRLFVHESVEGAQ